MYCPVLSYPVLSYTIISHPVLSFSFLSFPIMPFIPFYLILHHHLFSPFTAIWKEKKCNRKIGSREWWVVCNEKEEIQGVERKVTITSTNHRVRLILLWREIKINRWIDTWMKGCIVRWMERWLIGWIKELIRIEMKREASTSLFLTEHTNGT